MEPEPENSSLKATPQAGNVPPVLPASEPQPSGAQAPVGVVSPPPLPAKPERRPWPVRVLVILLTVCLGFFLADAAVSLVDDSLILFFDVHVLTLLRGLVFLFAAVTGTLVYVLMGLTPMIPKRLFLPVTLFNPVAGLLAIPCLIYFYGRSQQVSWLISLCQLLVGLGILHSVQGGFKFRWPLIAGKQLGARGFSWLNLCAFLSVNVFVLLPAVIFYLAGCAALAADHFSDGFLALRPGGLTVQMRKYTRQDGKTLLLVPMAHIGEPAFYRKLVDSFPINSTILMEGVSDHQNLLTNKITYKRMATSLGLAEQQNEFKPSPRQIVQADVDVEEFAKDTIGFLNLVMMIHSKGVNVTTVQELMRFSPPPDFEEQLFQDLLRKRNRRLLDEIHSQLSQSDNIIVPWGVAHMPEIAREIQKSGFRLQETHEYVAIRFRSAGK
jgi:hypothetical protein